MWHVWQSLVFEYERKQGFQRSRDFDYYSRASFACLEKWRRLVKQDTVSSLEHRKLYPASPEPDQIQMLEIREASSSIPIKKLIKNLFPIYNASAIGIELVSTAEDRTQIEVALQMIHSDKLIPLRIGKRLLAYSVILKRLLPA